MGGSCACSHKTPLTLMQRDQQVYYFLHPRYAGGQPRSMENENFRYQNKQVAINYNPVDEQWEKLGAWFVGHTSENKDEFFDLAFETIRRNIRPKNYFPDDEPGITPAMKASNTYRKEMEKMKDELDNLNCRLQESIPLPSVRYQGNVAHDTTIAAKLGYLSAWMTNSNNAASGGGPVTIQLEKEVADQLCHMIGFDADASSKPWGHITSGGTVSNVEALWSSRNAKYFPLAVQKAIQTDRSLISARGMTVFIPRLGIKQKIIEASAWDLLNLDINNVVELPQETQKNSGLGEKEFKNIIQRYNIADIGFVSFYNDHQLKSAPVIIGSVASHFSLQRAATLLGIGSRNMVSVPLDQYARMDISALRVVLQEMLDKMVPVVAVVCVVGSTEYGAVDAVSEVLQLRMELRNKGMNFAILVDAAFGGYFVSMLKRDTKEDSSPLPNFPMSEYTRQQFHSLANVDTVTIDPHKTGYCPYPAGALCYRNGNMNTFIGSVTDMLPIDKDKPINCFGLETSKPGAGAAGVYLAHKVIGLHRHGYGRILGQAMMGAKLFYCAWLTAADPDDDFVCVPLIPVPPTTGLDESTARIFIRQRIFGTSYSELNQDVEAMQFLTEVGSDLPINAFAVNIKGNTSRERCNRLNLAVYDKLSHKDPGCTSVNNIVDDSDEKLTVLRSTVLNPWTAANNNVQMLTGHFRDVVRDCITERLLQRYKNEVNQEPGTNKDIIYWMKNEATYQNLSPDGYEGGLIIDEMSLQEDLQMKKQRLQEFTCFLKFHTDFIDDNPAIRQLLLVLISRHSVVTVTSTE
ncbi:uncharacterized protein LOC110465666 [Mizuhopecten yessoensis]|uniref:uncharacterized protein LOC110465666 n=1 Tax=Mizuhopecten yessoensis TaxID=6573 RepID=UPI000B45B527|nr:uncharacterized protein LOC110465666 [Mizuhopecten yessoensis]